MKILGLKGEVINSKDEWGVFAPPQKDYQWADGRSAKEEAGAWFRTEKAALPAEISALLASHDLTRGFSPEVVRPEYVIRLDKLTGNHRNTDVAIAGLAGSGSVAINIEAKADEAFGSMLIGAYLDQKEGTSSNVPERIRRLLKAVLGRDVDDVTRPLRYQLLHAVAASVIWAKECQAAVAVFMIHEFITQKTTLENREANHRDYDAFMRLLLKLDNQAPLPEGVLMGPICLPGDEYTPSDIPLLVGRTSYCLTDDPSC